MPDPILKFLRDFNRFTDDGLPDEPAGAPLPVGDPESGVYVPTKRDLRELLTAVEAFATGLGLPLYNIGPAFTTRALAALAVADGTLADGQYFTVAGVQFRVKASLTLEQSAFNVEGQAGVDFVNITDKPLFVLCLGQSNMRGSVLTVGGDYSIPDNVYAYDNGQTVAGTKFRRPEFGNYPFDITDDGGVTYCQSLPLSIARELRLKTGRPIYMLTIAKGDTLIEGWITDATLASNSWSRGGDTDMTAVMYPQIADAMAQVPGNNGKIDMIVWHHGEANSADDALTYRSKFAAVYNDLTAAGYINANQTIVAAGGLNEDRATYFAHKVSMSSGLTVIPNMRYVDSSGLTDRGDGTHFSGPAKTQFGTRYADAITSPNPTRTAIDTAGIFTPAFADAATGGNLAGVSGTSGSLIKGRWERRGRRVLVWGNGVFLDTSGMTGGNSLVVQNLPFRMINDTDHRVIGTVELRRVTFSGYVTCYINPSEKVLRFRQCISNDPGSDLTVAGLTDDLASVRFAIEYITDM